MDGANRLSEKFPRRDLDQQNKGFSNFGLEKPQPTFLPISPSVVFRMRREIANSKTSPEKLRARKNPGSYKKICESD